MAGHMSNGKKRTKKTISIIAAIVMISVLGGLTLTACSQDSAIGFWIIEKVTAGDVVMTEQDASSIGLNAVGTIKLQKSGKCELNILGEESEGTWEKDKNGTITINYGKGQTLSGKINKKGKMKLTDPQGAEYILEK